MQPTEPTTEAVAVPPARSTWQALKDSIRGTEADYTQIDLKRAILLLAVPMILELVMESTFAVVDIFFVGKLGASAIATVGLTETYLFLLYSVAMGLATAQGLASLLLDGDLRRACGEAIRRRTERYYNKRFVDGLYGDLYAEHLTTPDAPAVPGG